MGDTASRCRALSYLSIAHSPQPTAHIPTPTPTSTPARACESGKATIPHRVLSCKATSCVRSIHTSLFHSLGSGYAACFSLHRRSMTICTPDPSSLSPAMFDVGQGRGRGKGKSGILHPRPPTQHLFLAAGASLRCQCVQEWRLVVRLFISMC